MKHNLIIDTGQHFLPPASSLWLLVSDEDLNNFWIMVGWQMCYMRPNTAADAGLCDVGPLVLHGPLQHPPPYKAIWGPKQQLGRRMVWWPPLSTVGHSSQIPLLGDTNPSFAPMTCCFLPSLQAPGHHLTPNSFHLSLSRQSPQSQACKEWGGPRAQPCTASPERG